MPWKGECECQNCKQRAAREVEAMLEQRRLDEALDALGSVEFVSDLLVEFEREAQFDAD
jgi:hypothetical protein